VKAERDPAWAEGPWRCFAGYKRRGKGISIGQGGPATGVQDRLLFVRHRRPDAGMACAVRQGLPANFLDLASSRMRHDSAFSPRAISWSCRAMRSPSAAFTPSVAIRKTGHRLQIPVIQEIIDDEKDGLLVPFGDVPALTRAVELLADDPDLRERLGRAGGEKTRARFDNRLFVNAFGSRFPEVVQEHPGGPGSERIMNPQVVERCRESVRTCLAEYLHPGHALWRSIELALWPSGGTC